METTIKSLREQRMHSVQNDIQYLYVYRGFVEKLIDRGVTKRLDVLKFINDYDSLIRRKRPKPVEQPPESKDKQESSKKDKDKDDYTPSVYFDPYHYQ
ncbi:unnamed protein product [Heligmosomoides polygyrus]|uniref:DUF4296 domain-containing protein n=1 Tax=Heligmosomoides polygyrus TaxID=6339 RepID=A0A183GVR0_HELPZ|nr:unnamed protein product [Heligmosomoides polygyrus]